MGAAERALAARQQQRRRCLLLDAQLRPQEAGQQEEKRQRAQPGEPDREAQPEPRCPLPPTRLQRQCAAVLHRRYPTATLLVGCVPGRPAPPPLAQPERWAWRKAFPWPPPPPRPQQQPEPAFVPGTPPESGRSTPTYFRKSARAAQVDPLFADSDASSVTYSDRFDPDSDDEPQAQQADGDTPSFATTPAPGAASAPAPDADRIKYTLETLAAIAAVQPRLSYGISAAAARRAAVRVEEGMLADACAPGPGGDRGPHPGNDRPPHASGLELLWRYKHAALRGVADMHSARNMPRAPPLGHLSAGTCGDTAAAVLLLERLRPGLLQAQPATWGLLVAMAETNYSALWVLQAATLGVQMLHYSGMDDEDLDVLPCALLTAVCGFHMADVLLWVEHLEGGDGKRPTQWAPAQIYDIMLYGMAPPAALWQGGGAGPASTGGPPPPPPYQRLSISYVANVCRILFDDAWAASMLARAALTKQLLRQQQRQGSRGAGGAAPLELPPDHPALRDRRAALRLLLARGPSSATPDEPGPPYDEPQALIPGLYDSLFLPCRPARGPAARRVAARLAALGEFDFLDVHQRGDAEAAELRATLRRTAAAAADLAGAMRPGWWGAMRHFAADREYARFAARAAAVGARAHRGGAALQQAVVELWERRPQARAPLAELAERLQPGLLAAHPRTWRRLLAALDRVERIEAAAQELREAAQAALLGLSAVAVLELPLSMLHMSYCTVVGTYMQETLNAEREYQHEYHTTAARVVPMFLQLLFIPLPIEALQPEPGWTSVPPPPPPPPPLPPPLPLPMSPGNDALRRRHQDLIRTSLMDSLARQDPADASWQAALAEHLMLRVRQQALEAQGRARSRPGAGGEVAVDIECTVMAYEVAVHALVELVGEAGSRGGSPARIRGAGGAGRGEAGGGTSPGGGRSSGHVSESDVDEGDEREREPARGEGAENAAGVSTFRLSAAARPRELVVALMWLMKGTRGTAVPAPPDGQQQPHQQQQEQQEQQEQPGQQPGQQQPRPLAELVLVGAEYMSFVLLMLDRLHLPRGGDAVKTRLLVQPCCGPELTASVLGVEGHGQVFPPASGSAGVVQLSTWAATAPDCMDDWCCDWKRLMRSKLTVSATSKWADARRVARKALMEERHGAFQLVGKGVEGVQRALMMAAQIRQDMQAAGRDLCLSVLDTNLMALQEAEAKEQLQRQRQRPHERTKGERQPAGDGHECGRPGGGGAAERVHKASLRVSVYLHNFLVDQPRLAGDSRGRRLLKELVSDVEGRVQLVLAELRRAGGGGGGGAGGLEGLEMGLLLYECEPGRPDRLVAPERVASTVGLQRLERMRVQKKMLEG